MLFDVYGNRKYLTARERIAFIRASQALPPKAHTFCLMLAYTGARISEVLALTPSRIDYDNGLVIFETLKRRRKGLFRAVPVPRKLLTQIRVIHEDAGPDERLWSWSRTTGWKHVKSAMATAGITAPRASPKALRHAFGVLGTTDAQISLALMQKWLGHAKIETTAIYANAVGPEERSLARRMWR